MVAKKTIAGALMGLGATSKMFAEGGDGPAVVQAKTFGGGGGEEAQGPGGELKLVLEDRSIAGLMAAESELNVTMAKGLNTLVLKSVHTFAADFVDDNGNFGPVGGPIHRDSEWGLALGVGV